MTSGSQKNHMSAEQRLYHFVSSILSSLGVAVVRRRTLDRLVRERDEQQATTAVINPAPQQPNAPPVASPAVPGVSDFQRNALTALLQHQIASKWSAVDQLLRALPAVSAIRQCPLCGFEDQSQAFPAFDSHCIFGGGVLLRHQCPRCDLVFGPDKMLDMTAEELTQDYEWHYRVYQEGDSTPQELRSFHALHPARDGVYLNYGAGSWSRSVQVLRDEGWQVFGFEPHASAMTDGASGFMLDRHSLLAQRFDGIYSNNVLEHLRRPVEELRFLASLLKPGGRMAHTTPCFEYLYPYTRFHLFFFLGKSRLELVAQAELAEIEYIEDGEFLCSVLTPSGS